MSVPRRARAGLEKAARHAPALGLERAADTREALGIRRGVLRVRKPKDRDAAEGGYAEKIAAEDQALRLHGNRSWLASRLLFHRREVRGFQEHGLYIRDDRTVRLRALGDG